MGEELDVVLALGEVDVEFLAFIHIPGGRLMKSPSAPAESQTLTSIR